MTHFEFTLQKKSFIFMLWLNLIFLILQNSLCLDQFFSFIEPLFLPQSHTLLIEDIEEVLKSPICGCKREKK